MKLLDTDKIRSEWETDETVRRVKSMTRSGIRNFPSATARYATDKVPIIQWLPHYNGRWILPDFIAGLTVGVMMVPQALAYAKIATIDGQFGLYSSWIPAAIYVFMGTSKGKAFLHFLASNTVTAPVPRTNLTSFRQRRPLDRPDVHPGPSHCRSHP